MKVIVLDTCRKEIRDFPENIKLDLLELINDLSSGLSLMMPVSKRMEGMGKGVFELIWPLNALRGCYEV